MLVAVTARRGKLAQDCMTRSSSTLLPVRSGFVTLWWALLRRRFSESYLKRGALSICSGDMGAMVSCGEDELFEGPVEFEVDCALCDYHAMGVETEQPSDDKGCAQGCDVSGNPQR